MARQDAQARVLEEWFRLPESRRSHATDAVAFAFRLLRDEPDLFRGTKETSHEMIVKWLLPHIHKVQLMQRR
jgi:hypothetical protein